VKSWLSLRLYRGEEISPGSRTDAELDEFVRSHAETAFHPSCSCKMGEDDMAVVDGQGRVHGVQGLRVVDASIMPLIITGNLNATTIMIAEKIADQIRGKNSLVLKRLITKRVQHLYVKRRYVQYYKEVLYVHTR
jgi:choline dehydrogenase-like flavoprotein